jgi:hypothetical protein
MGPPRSNLRTTAELEIAGEGERCVPCLRDFVYAATENNSVYAFDADTKQSPLWHVSFLSPGVTSVPAPDTNEATILPQIGITGTRAGLALSGGVLYVPLAGHGDATSSKYPACEEARRNFR